MNITVASLVWGLVAVVATMLAARYAARATLRLAGRMQGLHEDVALQAARVVRYAVLLVGAGVLLSILGADIQPVLVATLLLLGAAALMARGIADNLGASLVIQARRAIRLGDYVDLAGVRGHVSDLNTRTVVLEVNDGRTLHVPNRSVLDDPFTNLSVRGRLRAEVEVRVPRDPAGLDAPLDGETLAAALLPVQGVLPTPPPHALLTASEPTRRTFTLRFWHEPEAGPQVCSRVATELDRLLTSRGERGAVIWPPPDQPLTRPGRL
nr:mechanosensitive ion channel domain-containing protein [Ornithinimicrobium sp. F0845]